ncbi:MAG: hypothetical protein J6W06_07600 [Bacteroidales bacterium]|nr:hypothetical protein [Bacteroidales bacterium]
MRRKLFSIFVLVSVMEMIGPFAYSQSEKFISELGLDGFFCPGDVEDCYNYFHNKYGDYKDIVVRHYNFFDDLIVSNVEIDSIYDNHISISIRYLEFGKNPYMDEEDVVDPNAVGDGFSLDITCPIPKTIPDYVFSYIFSESLQYNNLGRIRSFSKPIGDFIYSLSEEVADLYSLEQWRNALEKRKKIFSNKKIRIPILALYRSDLFYFVDQSSCTIMQNDNNILSLCYQNYCCGPMFSGITEYVTYQKSTKKKIVTEQDWADLLNIDIKYFKDLVKQAIKEKEKSYYGGCYDNIPSFFVKDNWLCADFCVTSKFHGPRIAIVPLTYDAKQRIPYKDGIEQY